MRDLIEPAVELMRLSVKKMRLSGRGRDCVSSKSLAKKYKYIFPVKKVCSLLRVNAPMYRPKP
jgi:hypothetical protein